MIKFNQEFEKCCTFSEANLRNVINPKPRVENRLRFSLKFKIIQKLRPKMEIL